MSLEIRVTRTVQLTQSDPAVVPTDPGTFVPDRFAASPRRVLHYVLFITAAAATLGLTIGSLIWTLAGEPGLGLAIGSALGLSLGYVLGQSFNANWNHRQEQRREAHNRRAKAFRHYQTASGLVDRLRAEDTAVNRELFELLHPRGNRGKEGAKLAPMFDLLGARDAAEAAAQNWAAAEIEHAVQLELPVPVATTAEGVVELEQIERELTRLYERVLGDKITREELGTSELAAVERLESALRAVRQSLADSYLDLQASPILDHDLKGQFLGSFLEFVTASREAGGLYDWPPLVLPENWLKLVTTVNPQASLKDLGMVKINYSEAAALVEAMLAHANSLEGDPGNPQLKLELVEREAELVLALKLMRLKRLRRLHRFNTEDRKLLEWALGQVVGAQALARRMPG